MKTDTRPSTDPGKSQRSSALLRWIEGREIIPDPHGWLGLVLIGGVLLCHICLPGASARYLFSENVLLEILGHAWLLLGPPAALYLGVRHVLVRGDSPVPLVTVPLAFLITALTGVGVTLAFLG